MNSLSIIIVTFNSQETIDRCLESVIKYSPGSQIIVVDNNSQDQTITIVKKYNNKVKLINSSKNLGFAKANNLGVKSATGKYLVFLNPDTRLLKENSLKELVGVLIQNSEYGIVAPKLIYPDKTEQARTRHLPTISRAFQEYILGIKGVYDFYQASCQTLCGVESVTGACLVISKNLFDRVGGFNEKYFLYYEDLQLCKDIRSLNYKIGYLPEVTVEHTEGVSGVNQKTQKLLQDSAKKYHGLFSYFLIQSMIRVSRFI